MHPPFFSRLARFLFGDLPVQTGEHAIHAVFELLRVRLQVVQVGVERLGLTRRGIASDQLAIERLNDGQLPEMTSATLDGPDDDTQRLMPEPVRLKTRTAPLL